jgi:TetR/AcrR family transcriptional regulator
MDNRTRLLEVALRLFAARGYDAVGVQEIVEAAGVTKPTLYHHFGNKLGLLQALVARHGEPLEGAVAKAATYRGDLPGTLNQVVNTYFDQATRDPDYHRFRLALWLAPPESEAGGVVAAQLARESARLEAMFDAAVRDHGNMRGRARLYTASLQGMVHAHVALMLRGQAQLDAELAHRAVHQFMHGIYS